MQKSLLAKFGKGFGQSRRVDIRHEIRLFLDCYSTIIQMLKNTLTEVETDNCSFFETDSVIINLYLEQSSRETIKQDGLVLYAKRPNGWRTGA